MVVTDDGIGFDVQVDLTKANRFGLLNIQESLERLGGFFDITASVGSGCRVTLGAPLVGAILAQQQDTVLACHQHRTGYPPDSNGFPRQ